MSDPTEFKKLVSCSRPKEVTMSEDEAMTIVEFLLARIAEDESFAHAADRSRWRGEDKGITFDMYSDHYDDGEAMARLEADTRANADLIAEFSPSRVLTECEAKRRIVEEARDYSPELAEGDNGEWAFDVVLRALAAVYADRPGFDPAWLDTPSGSGLTEV